MFEEFRFLQTKLDLLIIIIINTLFEVHTFTKNIQSNLYQFLKKNQQQQEQTNKQLQQQQNK